MDRWGDTRDEARFLLAEESDGSPQRSLRRFEFHGALWDDFKGSEVIRARSGGSEVPALIQVWVSGLAVLEFLDRLPSVGEVGCRRCLVLELSGAVKMD